MEEGPPDGVATAAAGGTSGKENAAAAAAQLREHVVRRVLSSDVLNSVKAHLRARLYAELKGSGAAAASANAGGGGSTHLPNWRLALRAPPPSPSLHQHILNCLVSEFLLVQRYTYTLSVFLSETGSGSLPRLSRADLLRLVGVLPESKVHALLTSSEKTGGIGAAHSSCSEPDSSGAAASLAECMVAALGVLGGRVSTQAAACQTSCNGCFEGARGWECCSGGSGAAGGGCSGSVTAASQQLSARLAAIEAEYQRKSGALEAAAAASLEERMAAFQRECDARCAAQLAERLAALREGELAAVREEEAGRHAAALAAERAALAAAHQERLTALNKQEEELLERGRRLHRDHDQLREEQLRRQRADENCMQVWRAECEARLAARESAAKQQAEQAAAAVRSANAAREEGERRLAARLAEVAGQEAEAVRSRAAAEAEVGRVASLQRQLAVALEEQGALRQQLASAQAAHSSATAALRNEGAALRQDMERLAATAAASASAATAATTPPGVLSPSDSARLQQAVRRLMLRVEQLQEEVDAGRERERLWRVSASEAEKLLGKATKAQDRALQHAEELRLALAAAVREVADLQQQAALAGAGVEGPRAEALQAACRDAQRWREGAEARVSAAKQAEEGLRGEAAQLQQRMLANRSAIAAGLQQLLGARVQGRQQAAVQEDEDDTSTAEPSPEEVQAAALPGGGIKGGDSSRPGQAGWAQQAAQQPHQQEQPAWMAGPPPLPLPSHQHQPLQQQHKQEQPAWLAAASQSAQQLPHQQAPAPASATATGSLLMGSSLMPPAQQAQSMPAPGEASKPPPSRTASDILAAYRARQQQQRSVSSSGVGLLPAGLSRGATLSPETSSSAEEASGSEAAADAVVAGMPLGRPARVGDVGRHGQPAGGPKAQAAAAVAGAAAAGAAGGDADGYYVSDFTSSEDSCRF